MMHPTSYINKMLFASDNKIELWNVIDNERVFEFKNILQDRERVKIT